MSSVSNLVRARAYELSRSMDVFEQGGAKAGMSALDYQTWARELEQVFTSAPSRFIFSDLLRNSSAAREMAESIEIERRIFAGRAEYCPLLETLLARI